MLSIQRILWPTDFSDGAEHAFPYAAVLADWHEAELHCINVREGTPDVRAGMAEHFPVSLETLASYLASAEGKAPPVDVEDLSIRQEQADASSPADAILSYADEQDMDLVVSGTHGRRGLQRLLIGSVAEELIRRSSCPVLTVRAGPDAAAAWTVDTILVPVDFSTEAEHAVRYAKELAHTYEAEIILLHAVEQVTYPQAYGMDMADVPGENVLQRVEESLAEMADSLIDYEHVVVDSAVGHAPSVILEYQDEHDVDLTTISTHGRSGLERLLLGGVSERVVRRATSPVFVVKSFGKSLLPPSAEHDSPR